MTEITPFQIDLALQLYHEFVSKQLVDTLHVHGFCSLYDEVRRYLTSLANHEIDKIKTSKKSLNSVVCNILPAAHAITGCDTTSSFFGIGKKSMLKALKETPDQFSDLSMISHADVDDSVDVCRKLISRLYDPKGKSKRCHSDLNRFRVKLATCRFQLD